MTMKFNTTVNCEILLQPCILAGNTPYFTLNQKYAHFTLFCGTDLQLIGSH